MRFFSKSAVSSIREKIFPQGTERKIKKYLRAEYIGVLRASSPPIHFPWSENTRQDRGESSQKKKRGASRQKNRKNIDALSSLQADSGRRERAECVPTGDSAAFPPSNVEGRIHAKKPRTGLKKRELQRSSLKDNLGIGLLSHTRICSIMGDEALNYRVRNGIGCTRFSMDTKEIHQIYN